MHMHMWAYLLHRFATAKVAATLFSHPIKFFGGLGKLLTKPKGASALTKPSPKA